jgi:hypothetical protein
MEEIGSTGNVRVSIDKANNRVLMVFTGDILNSAAVEPVPNITRTACDKLRPRFSCLADFTGMKLFSETAFGRQIQDQLMLAGVRKVAAVWSHDSFAKFVLDKAAEKVGPAYVSRRRSFMDVRAAEKWLDE